MEMAVRSMETVETAMETDGDGSGALPRPGWVPEQRLLSPRNSLEAAVELRNCSGNFADSLRVFRPEALYRRRGIVRGQPGVPHTRVARPVPGPCHLCVRAASRPSPALFRSSGSFQEK
jgi:hypothetical protein